MDPGPPVDPPGPPGRRRLWPARDLVWLALSAIGLTALAALAANAFGGGDDITEIQLLLVGSSLALALPAGLLVAARPARRSAVGLVRTTLREHGRALTWLLALFPLTVVVTLALQAVIGTEQHPQAGMMLDRMTPGQLAFAAGFTVLAVPFAEELIFRGVLLSALLERGPPDPIARQRRAVIVSSVLFGLVHFEPQIMIQTGLLGAAAALLRLRSGSLWPAVTLHAVNNAVATAVLASGAA